MTGGSGAVRRALGCAGLVAASAATTGCALAGVGVEPLSQPVERGRLVGHWTADSRCPHTTMDLAADGTGRVQRFPTDADADTLKVTRTDTGPVRWRQEPGLGTSDFPAGLSLDSGAQSYELDYGRDNRGFVLVATVGDPDNGIACVYHRTAVPR
jgi:hypothetical protein